LSFSKHQATYVGEASDVAVYVLEKNMLAMGKVV